MPKEACPIPNMKGPGTDGDHGIDVAAVVSHHEAGEPLDALGVVPFEGDLGPRAPYYSIFPVYPHRAFRTCLRII